MPLFTAHINEIALKGRNRYLFEDRLIANISAALRGKIGKMEKLEKRIFFEADEIYAGEVKAALAKIFGIEWFAEVHEVKKDRDAIMDKAIELLGNEQLKNKTIKVETKRGDKTLPFTSMELSRDAGEALIGKLGCKVDVHNPDITIHVEILRGDRAFIYFEKSRGAGGLPTGCSGLCVSLLSGGIDSPVASWMLMRRGAKIIFLHVHALPDASDVEKSKIAALARELAKWQGGAKLYLADYSEFYKKTLSIPPKYELVLFKRFINMLAQEVAKREGALAIISGDSLGQVASQTLENISAASSGVHIPFFRPLIGMDKQDIIQLAQRIGTYDISIKEYKDCCSLVSESPETRANAEFVEKLAENMGLSEIVSKTAEKLGVMEIK